MRFHSISVIIKPTTHNKNSSNHSILHSPVVDVVNTANKDCCQSYGVPAADVNATRKTAEGETASLGTTTLFLELCGTKAQLMLFGVPD